MNIRKYGKKIHLSILSIGTSVEDKADALKSTIRLRLKTVNKNIVESETSCRNKWKNDDK